MSAFGWIGADEPPKRWDLRFRGWDLCHDEAQCPDQCRHALICDTFSLSRSQLYSLVDNCRSVRRLVLLSVEQPQERAALLELGCAEVLPANANLAELDSRAKRVCKAALPDMLPRWREIGELRLDLFHRDARYRTRWLGLHPREFGVLWRLSDTPGLRVSRRQLLSDVWRMSHDPETNSVEVHVSRLRAKLAAFDSADLIETDPHGGYRLSRPNPARKPAEA